ncbi:MAG TPA: TIGR03619 family F420-dependent LLM class oxidoreductase [Vicinamibacteria bacterium]|nr:TIGR03619 family F420-dependent LLM class oxidoreductase [Vicinamibacteria bacterium]
MKLGFSLPVAGPSATAEGITRVAKRAEELGYHSLWTWERLLVPLKPQTSYIGTADGSYPDYFSRVMDPLDVLTFAAAHTSRIRLGVSVAVMGHYHPLPFARRCATIDVLSGGRLDVGLGQGWSKDEHDAMGVAMKDRARRADEFVDVLKKAWTEKIVEFQGDFFQVPPSRIDLKPVQKPHPPIYMAAFSPGAMNRIAAKANGWTPVAVPIKAMPDMLNGIKEMAKAEGRAPTEIKLVVRANVHVTDKPLAERFPYVGSWDQILSDIEETRRLGADELFVDPQGGSPETFLEVMERLRP